MNPKKYMTKWLQEYNMFQHIVEQKKSHQEEQQTLLSEDKPRVDK
jgi:hypothetical protein